MMMMMTISTVVVYIWVVLAICRYCDAVFTEVPGTIKTSCSSTNISLVWRYPMEAVLGVQWSKDSTTLMVLTGGGSLQYATGITEDMYTHEGNGVIKIIDTDVSDAGQYTCQVTYTNGIPQISSSTDVVIYPAQLDAPHILQEKDGDLTCTANPSAIAFASLTMKVDGVRHNSLTVHISNVLSSVECCLEGAAVQCVSGTIPATVYCLPLIKGLSTSTQPVTTVTTATTATTTTTATTVTTATTTSGVKAEYIYGPIIAIIAAIAAVFAVACIAYRLFYRQKRGSDTESKKSNNYDDLVHPSRDNGSDRVTYSNVKEYFESGGLKRVENTISGKPEHIQQGFSALQLGPPDGRAQICN